MNSPVYTQAKNLYLRSKKMIEVEDFGAGSRRMSSKRSVSQMFQTSSNTGVYAQLLNHLTRAMNAKKVLELGTNLGMGSMAISYKNSGLQCTTVEGCKETATIAKASFEKLGFENIEIVNKTFTDFLQSCDADFDFVYIDGHHLGKALLEYLRLMREKFASETLYLLDDVRWTKDMKKALKVIEKQEPEVYLDFGRMVLIQFKA